MKVICVATVGLFFSVSFCAAGQQLSDSLLATFYNKTLSAYFSDTTINKEQIKFGCILVRTNFDTTNLVKNVGVINLKYFNDKTSEISMLNKPLKRNIGRSIYNLNDKKFGNDTVDVNIGKSGIVNVTKRHIWINASCGGAMGYIPNGRFIYDKVTNSWSFISGREIGDAMFRELKKQLHRD